MKIAVQTGGITDRFGIEAGFDMIRRAGFEAVDANLDHWLTPLQIRNGRAEESLLLRSDGEIAEVCAPYLDVLAHSALTVTQAHAPFPTRVGDERANALILRALEKTIAVCGRIGCPRLVVHPGFLPFAESAEEAWQHNLRMYTALIPALRAHGVMCCLENRLPITGPR